MRKQIEERMTVEDADSCAGYESTRERPADVKRRYLVQLFQALVGEAVKQLYQVPVFQPGGEPAPPGAGVSAGARSVRQASWRATKPSITAKTRSSVSLAIDVATTSPTLVVGTEAAPTISASRQRTVP
jgi:hypothetical protein